MSGTVEERNAAGSGSRRGMSPTKTAVGIGCAAAALIGYVFWADSGEKPEKTAQQENFIRVAAADFSRDATPVVIPISMPLPSQPPPVPAPQFAPAAAQPGGAAPAKAPRMVSFAVTAPPAPATPAGGSGGPPGAEAAGGPTSVAFAGQRIAGGRAGVAIDTSLTLMPGIYSCILDTAVSSERSGPFQCHTDENILSPLGVPLMEAGTTIIGSYTSDVRQGQSRIASLVATAWTPQGVPVPLGAHVTDELGRNGMSGQVNRHLVERFGGAVMLLLSQGAIDFARSALRQGSGNSSVSINTGGVQNLASDALRSSINIPNTIEKNQGERIGFFVTAPVSFADAYRLTPR